MEQGELLHSHPGLLDGIFALQGHPSPAAKLLQFARSVPGVAGILVGHKSRDHVEANLAVSKVPRLGEKAFDLVRAQVAAAVRRAAAAEQAQAQAQQRQARRV